VDQGPESFWSFCVDYLETGQGGAPPQHGRIDYRKVLKPQAFALFAKLLKPEPYINRCRCGMDFLGGRVYPSHTTLNRRGRVRFQRRLRRLQGDYVRGTLGALELQRRATALVAFTRAGPTVSWRWRDRVLRLLRVDGQGLAPGHPGR